MCENEILWMRMRRKRNRPAETSNNAVVSQDYKVNKLTMFKEIKVNLNHLGKKLETIKSDGSSMWGNQIEFLELQNMVMWKLRIQ